MTMNAGNERTDLTADEREVAGNTRDLVSEERVVARRPAASVMISLRIERSVFEALSSLAEDRERTFSETAREALRAFVGLRGADGAYPVAESASGGGARRVSEHPGSTWDDDDLQSALERYELACRHAAMREKAWRSYVDYARQFLAWRTGDYRPRGVRAGDRPVPRSGVSTDELRHQAAQYANQVQAAGREQPTVDTYFRHAMFFIRWLEGDFRPGARLAGLR